jgi:[ribosomal protein S5]-alanine N-acetyltransferase
MVKPVVPWHAVAREGGSTRWKRAVASPPDICAFGESCHRLEDETIHLWISLNVKCVDPNVGNLRLPSELLMPMELETSRLTLRPFREEDLGRLAELMANADFMRFSLGPYTHEQTQTVLQKFLSWNKTGLPSPFAVVLRANNDLLGYCGFLHHAEVPGEVEIGYRLDPAYWNRGLITEAARAVRDHAFVELRLPRVISLIHPENVSSRRVAEKIGMTAEKEITFRGFPTILFALSREHWQAKRGAE